MASSVASAAITHAGDGGDVGLTADCVLSPTAPLPRLVAAEGGPGAAGCVGRRCGGGPVRRRRLGVVGGCGRRGSGPCVLLLGCAARSGDGRAYRGHGGPSGETAAAATATDTETTRQIPGVRGR